MPTLTTTPTSRMTGPETTAVAAGTRKRLLVVDDDPNVLDALRHLLDGIEADVETCADASRAMALLEDGVFDLVIADQRMPKVSGLEVLGRARARSPHVPTILLTGHADAASREAAYERFGVFRYLTKPWDNGDLLGTVKDALRASAALS